MASFQQQFLQSLPKEMRESEALRESLKTSESFKAFAASQDQSSRGDTNPLTPSDVAAWARSGGASSFESPASPRGDKVGSSTATKVGKDGGGTPALEYKGKGNALFAKGAFKKAIDAYGKGIRKLQPWQSSFQGGAPNRSIPQEQRDILMAMHSNRAACYLKLGMFASCVGDCNAVLRINKNHVKALYRRGQSLRALGRLDEAQVDLERLIKLEPSNSVARISLEQLVQAQNAKAVRCREVEDKNLSSRINLSGATDEVAALKLNSTKSACTGACYAMTELLRESTDVENNCTALKSFTAELNNMLSSVSGGVGNEIFSSGLDEVLLDIFTESDVVTPAAAATLETENLRAVAAETFANVFRRLYALMDEEAPADGTPHFFGSERLGLRAQFRTLIKTSLTGNKHQLSKLRLFLSDNIAAVDWVWVANAYRETCSRIARGDTQGAYVHTFEAQVLRAGLLGSSGPLFEQLGSKGGLGNFLLSVIQPKLKQFAVLAAVSERNNTEEGGLSMASGAQAQ